MDASQVALGQFPNAKMLIAGHLLKTIFVLDYYSVHKVNSKNDLLKMQRSKKDQFEILTMFASIVSA